MKDKKVRYKHQITSKGDRLHWTSLDEVKSVKISRELTVGKQLDASELSKRNNHFPSNTVLVP